MWKEIYFLLLFLTLHYSKSTAKDSVDEIVHFNGIDFLKNPTKELQNVREKRGK